MFQKIKQLALIACMTQSILLAQGATKPAANVKPPAKGDQKNSVAESKPAESIEATQSTTAWNPELGILGGVALPIGDAGQVLNMGFGGKIDLNTHVPVLSFLKQKSFEIRPGVFSGVALHSVKSSSKTGNFMAIPFVVYAEIDFTSVSDSFVPYFALGSGATMAIANSTTIATSVANNVSSIDATLYAALGGKVYFGAEKKFFVKAEAAFFMIFETVSGMFVQGNMGAGVRL